MDDDLPTLDVLHLSLTLDGHDVIRASEGAEGLAWARRTRVDLVNLDWMMPGMDGITLTEELRAQPRRCHLPIIMLTAKDLPSDVREGFRSGVDAYVTKPLDLDVLRGEIERLCHDRLPTPLPPVTPLVHEPLEPCGHRKGLLGGLAHSTARASGVSIDRHPDDRMA